MTNRFVLCHCLPEARRKRALASCAMLCTLGLGVAVRADAPKIFVFEAPGAGTSAAPCLNQGTFPYGINDAGAIGGNFQDASNVLHGLLRTPEGEFVVFDAPGAGTGTCQGTLGFAINSEGEVVGKTVDANNVPHGMLRTPEGTVVTFDPPGAGTGLGQGSLATSVNSDGAITGIYLDASNVPHGFLRDPDGAISTIDAPGAGTGAFQGTVLCPTDCINAEGAVTGYYVDANNVFHGFLRTPDGAIASFDVPGAALGTAPGGINAEGVIAGVYGDASNVNHGFLREPDGAIVTFDVPGAGTGPNQGTLPTGSLGINAAGEITGSYVDANNLNHGFLRTRHGAIVTFDAPNAGAGVGQGTSPLGINREGAITGYYIDASNAGHGFLRPGRRCREDRPDRRDNCGRE